MEKLSNSIAAKISSELNMENDSKEVIAYGIFALLQIFASIILVVIFGLLFHVVIESLIISFSASILRKYSGGVHASSPGRCTLIGTTVCIVQAVAVSFIVPHLLNISLVLLLGLIVFSYSYCIIYRLAPVDSFAKPIKREEKRNRMKKSSMLVLGIYLIIAVIGIMLYLGIGTKNYLIYCLSIFAGVAWQTFTLTKCGHAIIGKLDTFFNHILICKEGKI